MLLHVQKKRIMGLEHKIKTRTSIKKSNKKKTYKTELHDVKSQTQKAVTEPKLRRR